jgi:hypothetical protein
MFSISKHASKRLLNIARFSTNNIHPEIDTSKVRSKAMRKKLDQGKAVVNVPSQEPNEHPPVEQFSFADAMKHNFVAGVGISLAFIVIGSIFKGMGF